MSRLKNHILPFGGAMADHRSLIDRAFDAERAYGWEKGLVRRLLRMIGSPPIAMRLWNGEAVTLPGTQPVATMSFADRTTLLKLLLDYDLHFGDAYSAGRIDVEGDLVEFLELVYRHVPRRPQAPPRSRNTVDGSRHNIHHHYDIGNDFYRLWLDDRMLYTCAYYANESMTLEQAQVAKMDHVCRKLMLKPGERVVEAGCGWGALALHMARRYGAKVRAFNLSTEQIAHATELAAREKLSHMVEFIQDDYRNITGRYDVFVSVGMLEHVGRENYRALGELIDRSLTLEGRGLIHTIGRHRPMPMSRWIESRIFPGADPPTLAQMMDIFEHRDFNVLDVENIRLHYAWTIKDWIKRYEQHYDTVKRMFDAAFARAWRLYLAGSAAAFTTSRMQLFQVVFNRYDNNNVPRTRAHVYEQS